MSINTHCQALLQWSKHNEQQLHIHVILKSLGKQNPNVGKPKERERERERSIIFKKVILAATYNFQQGKNSLKTPKNSPQFSA
jgi:predicted negative regulator of RcsB-dependent stress response